METGRGAGIGEHEINESEVNEGMEGDKRNVVLVTVDCLRADHLSCLGFTEETTPTMDRLAREGILFTQAISTGTSTPISFPGILASAYPRYRQEDHRWLPNEISLISEVMRRECYKTAAFHSAPFLSRYYSYDRGFMFFYDAFGGTGMSRIVKKYERYKMIILKAKFMLSLFTYLRLPYKRADIITDISLQWLRDEGRKSPFFIWLHYMDTHSPYLPPKEYMPECVERSELKKLMRKIVQGENN